jgi:hypothetical protein
MRAPDLSRRLARRSDFGSLQETFLVSGVVTILVIRTQLWATNYPQLGGGGLHIAHLLWGGVFMTITIGALLTYIGRPLLRPAAVLGGIGFGFFIDELGKFITDDNDYFFAPAAGLIYLIFMGLFLLSRSLRRRQGLTSAECVANALDIVGQARSGALEEPQRRAAFELLDRADPADPLVPAVRDLLARVDAMPAAPPSALARRLAASRERAERLVATAGFQRLTWVVFALWAIGSAFVVLSLVLSVGLELGKARPGAVSDNVGDLSVVNIGSLASTAVSGVLVLVGVSRLRRSDRMSAYAMFERALLVQILVTSVFSFVESQFAAVFSAALALALLWSLRYVMRREESAARAASSEAHDRAAGMGRMPQTSGVA